jgi:WD40 repeat protein
VCAVQVSGRDLLASSSYDGTVRLWDPATGRTKRTLRGRTSFVPGMYVFVNGVCAVRVAGRNLLAVASEDGTVRLWDPATGRTKLIFQGDASMVSGLCAVRVAGRDLLAIASYEGPVRLWDPVPDGLHHTLVGHHSAVSGVCAVRVVGRDLLASCSDDGTVWLWDPATGTPQRTLRSDTRMMSGVSGVSAVHVGDRDLLASVCDDGIVRLWDPATGQALATIPVYHETNALTSFGDGYLVVGFSTGLLALRIT